MHISYIYSFFYSKVTALRKKSASLVIERENMAEASQNEECDTLKQTGF